MDDKEKKFITKIINEKNLNMNKYLEKDIANIKEDVLSNAKKFLKYNKIGFETLKKTEISASCFVIEQEVYFLDIFLDADKIVYKKNNEVVTINDYLLAAFSLYLCDIK